MTVTPVGHDERTAFALPAGFRAASTVCGLKASGAPDVALLVADRPCHAAAVFTTNRVLAAPVIHDREILAKRPDRIRAVVANSGCANACTGPRGLDDARRTSALAAAALGCDPDQVLVLSTGVIGVPLDMAKLERGIASAGRELADVPPGAGALDAGRAIMTTDTRPKGAVAELSIGGRSARVCGIAKGAGMIHPNMATMLAIVTTDVAIEHGALARALREATRRSFNRLSVDGDMSTNDTVLALASGVSGARAEGEDLKAFAAALDEVCGALARQIARDGEGATRLVEVHVTGAAYEEEAHRAADAIARSALVRTAIHGGDPNWGRILAAAGASGVSIDPDRLALAFGSPERPVLLVARGLPLEFDRDTARAALLSDPVVVRLDLGLGAASATVWTCDLSADYVAINAEYTT